MREYKDLVKETLHGGAIKPVRQGQTREKFGEQLTFHLVIGFPILTGRKMHLQGILGELAAFLKGPTHIKDFNDKGCNFWDIFADDDGSLRLAYGNAWRNFNGVDQLTRVVERLKTNPYRRSHLVSAWDPTGLDKLTLKCCHYSYQWSANIDGTLDMIWVQRSADLMLGLPSDIVVAAALNLLMAQTVGMQPGKIVLQLGSVHVYSAHYEAAEEYLNRGIHYLPSYQLDPKATVFNFEPEMLKLKYYRHEPHLNFEILP